MQIEKHQDTPGLNQTSPPTSDRYIEHMPAWHTRRRDTATSHAPASTLIELDPGEALTPEAIEAAALAPLASVWLSARAVRAMRRSAKALAQVISRGDPVYGLTTGFGPFVVDPACSCPEAQGAGLIDHLGAGWGPAAERSVVRASMLARARALANGCSGIDVRACDAMLALVRRGLTPEVPELGSVGASGDLVPLAHVARAISGTGRVHDARLSSSGIDDAWVDARDAMVCAGIAPVVLSARDALAIVNGTSFMTGYAAMAVARAVRLFDRAESITGWMYRQLGARSSALDPRLHRARNQMGQVRSAAAILAEANASNRAGSFEDSSRPLQEVYSVRCAPQILGACRDNLDHAYTVILREINGVNDNPVIVPETLDDPAAALHGGNFQGQQVAFASDILNHALVQAAILAERQLDTVLTPELNGGAPLLLAWEPGANAGLAGAQMTATSIVAEMRHHNQPAGNASMPTNGRNQDVVSMGTMAARTVYEQTERLAAVLGILAIGLRQLDGLRRLRRCRGPLENAPHWVPEFATMQGDRALRHDIQSFADAVLRHDAEQRAA